MKLIKMKPTIIVIFLLLTTCYVAAPEELDNLEAGDDVNQVLGEEEAAPLEDEEERLKRKQLEDYIHMVANQHIEEQVEEVYMEAKPLKTAELFQAINRSFPNLKLQSADIDSMTVKGYYRPPTSSDLSGSFMKFFDEILVFNTIGIKTLNYLSNRQRKNPKNRTIVTNSFVSPPKTANNAFGPFKKSQNQQFSLYHNNNTFRNGTRFDFPAQQNNPTQINGIKLNESPVQILASNINKWFVSLNEKINKLLIKLAQPIISKLIQKPDQMTNTDTASAEVEAPFPSRPRFNNLMNERPKSDATIVRPAIIKRQTTINGENSTSLVELNTEMQRSKSEPNCVSLNINQIKQCQSIEVLVSTNLNNSLPGTLPIIEENCKHLSFLLGNCWPDYLEQLKASLTTWNETLLATSDFPLPMGLTVNNNNQYTGSRKISCGVTPQISANMMDRISWMWLNLCMDRRFRLDYVDNLKCLSLWSQDRAHQVCSNEYRRMQTNLVPTDNSGGRTSSFANKSNSSSSNLNPVLKGDKVAEALERELESKILCCTFDVFLRCVFKQAARDCGKNGGQFVVNFMSRIGSDDMKFLCNNESRVTTIRNNKQPISRNRKPNNLYERGPFIEGSYCADSRIYTAIYGPSHYSGHRNHPASGGGNLVRGSNGRNNNRYSTFNNNSNFYGNTDSNGNSSPNESLKIIKTLIILALGFSFNTLLRGM